MKLLAILGSPHGMKSATGQLLSKTIQAAESSGAQVDLFEIPKMKIEPCRGCGACHKKGRCVIKDDFGAIKDDMLQADGVILASPNYIFSVTAQLKTFIDRCSCPIHCQALEGRYGASVVTSGGAGGEEVSQYMNRVLRALGCWTVGSVETEGWVLSNEAAAAPVFAKAADLGARLVAAIGAREAYPDQEEERGAFFARMKALVTRNKEEWPYEYEYWKSRGRL
ncbi:MAG: flavodoxin family protein [Candidatus Sumerlaeota bacterium]|nr:flavodoxin family protein [Candidatus Sumerlaeota bacterium]